MPVTVRVVKLLGVKDSIQDAHSCPCCNDLDVFHGIKDGAQFEELRCGMLVVESVKVEDSFGMAVNAAVKAAVMGFTVAFFNAACE